jgi:hypothetical protein
MTKLRWMRGAALAAALLVAMAGCGDNAGNPVSYFPEGQPSEAVLILGAIPGDSTLTTVRLVATIFSPPPADAFRLYLEPEGQGYRPATESPVTAGFTLGTGWSVYSSIVDGYDPAVASAVIGRGSRDGVESGDAPRTNVASVVATNPTALLRIRPVTLTQPTDSSIVGPHPMLTWNAVPGGARYLVQVFNATGGLHYSALVSSNSHVYGSGDGVIFESQSLRDGALYRWSVQALDGGYRVFAINFEPSAFFVSAPTP